MSQHSDILVVGLPGSLRADSHTRKAVAIALAGAAAAGTRTRLLDLRDYDLPLASGEEDEDAPAPGVARLRADLREAHGIVLGTPEYHGSYSGVLKNALDLCGFEEFEGKMLGLVGVSGGALGATNALNELRAVGRALHAWVVPEQGGVPRADRAFDAQGELVDERLRARLREVGREVARFSYLHSSQQWQEFLRDWETAVPNPGGETR